MPRTVMKQGLTARKHVVIIAVTPLTPGDDMAAQSGTGTAIDDD